MLGTSIKAWLAEKPRLVGYLFGLLFLLTMAGPAVAKPASYTITGP